MMNLKWIGAILIVVGCGGLGFMMAVSFRKEVTALRQLIKVLEFIVCELECRRTPLPDLCRKAAELECGCIKSVLITLAGELESQIAPDAALCMASSLNKNPCIPKRTAAALVSLGYTLGKFDLQGQLRELDAVCAACRGELAELETNSIQRTRGYQTLGLCAGAALAILLL